MKKGVFIFTLCAAAMALAYHLISSPVTAVSIAATAVLVLGVALTGTYYEFK